MWSPRPGNVRELTRDSLGDLCARVYCRQITCESTAIGPDR